MTADRGATIAVGTPSSPNPDAPTHSTARTNRLWIWYAACAIPATVAYLWLPATAAKLVVWPIIGWSSVAMIVVGIRRNRPSSPRAWYLLASGVATLVVGDNLYSFRSLVEHADVLFPSYVDVVYLAMYPLLVAGLAMFVHRRSTGRDRNGAIDACIISAALGLLSWVLLIEPYVRADDLAVLERLASLAYPVGDVALLVVAARLLVGRGRRPLSFWLVAGSLVPLLASDSLYGYANLAGTWHEHNLIDIGWIAFYVGWGAAALHPTMRQLTIASTAPRRASAVRLVIVGAAALVPPATLFLEGLDGRVTDPTAIAVVGALLLVLVLVRIAGLARETADVRSEARFHALVHDTSDAIVVLDRTGHVAYHTPSTERVLGWTDADLHDRVLAELLDETDRRSLELTLSDPAGASATVQWRMRRPDDGWRDLEVVIADTRDATDADRLVFTMRDITERNHLDRELRRQALHDSLTGLPNRTLFLDRVEQAIKLAHVEAGSVAVLLLDIDDFKEVNDSLGHAAGDELLLAVAERLTAAMSVGLTVARLGGDEFAVLLEGGADNDDLGFAALRIHAALQQPLRRGTDSLSMRASIGMSLAAARTNTPDDVLRQADLAMYAAKRSGKNRFEFFAPTMHDDATRRLGLAGELQTAITEHELVVFYQPIVEVTTGRFVGAEALVRWRHPRRGLLGPGEFIAVAEASGLIVPLGRLVLESACSAASAWKIAGIADEAFYVSVNLSARHLQDANVVHDVATTLAGTGLGGAALVLEVTETGLIEDLNPAGSTLLQLKQLGLRIAVDDFGTGYSSLAYLSSFPIDILKIDKSFVDQLTVSSDGETMVRAVIELAATLGLTAIGEGVEHAGQAEALERLGCHFAQGFVFAKPMPADQMVSALQAQTPAIHVSHGARRHRSDRFDAAIGGHD